MARQLASEKRRWWSNPSKNRLINESKKDTKGSSLSQEETASESSSFPSPGKFLNDFALPLWENPVNASEHAVVKNTSHPISAVGTGKSLLCATKARISSQLVKEVQTLPITAGPQPTTVTTSPENMIVIVGEDSTCNDDLTINEMDFVENSPDCRRSRYHGVPLKGRGGLFAASKPGPVVSYFNDLSLDVKTAKALQEEEIFRLALKRSLYDA